MEHEDDVNGGGRTPVPTENATGRGAHAARYILIGFFTVAPLRVTWLVFDFLLGILAGAGTPLLRAAGRAVHPFSETLSGWLLDSAFQKLIASLRKPPVSGQRAMLISFPTPEMKAVGFVPRVMRDEITGRELAAAYVPTSPTPTSGYIEIVPLEDVVQTGWIMEKAMSFVMTGGANAPDRVRHPCAPRKQEVDAP